MIQDIPTKKFAEGRWQPGLETAQLENSADQVTFFSQATTSIAGGIWPSFLCECRRVACPGKKRKIVEMVATTHNRRGYS